MTTRGKISWSRRRSIGLLVVAPAVSYLALLIPERETAIPNGAEKRPFVWNRDAFWLSLETQFKEARVNGCAGVTDRIDISVQALHQALDEVAAERFAATNPKFDDLEARLFQLAPLIAACPKRLPEFIRLVSRVRETVKSQSENWDLALPESRQRIYRLMYGARAALEEVMLQAPPDVVPALVPGRAEPSHTPSATIHGVSIHSGDILVSRGGAPTSALIARGNDFPGNFSHIALAHVDPHTRAASVIEAHIERGVVISTAEDYLRDKKLRVMALRLRADLSPLVADPMLPHTAASAALTQAKTCHIPYDFEMNYRDHSKQFCSEVASAAYQQVGVSLWMGLSHISSSGIISWLSAFGVKNFVTQEPSDIEYDPQLRVVAEWRDPQTLFQDHADNAVTDALLEGANAGEKLEYSKPMLPFARLAKTWSLLINQFGGVGPIPEGMSATQALRHRSFSRRHERIRAHLLRLAGAFEKENGYTAPYWELVKLARQAMDETNNDAP
jgi:hypothetical protein